MVAGCAALAGVRSGRWSGGGAERRYSAAMLTDLIGTITDVAAASGGAGVSPRARARVLAGVLALIVGLLLVLMAMVGLSAVRRRLRADLGRTASAQGKRRRRVDAWAEAGKRVEPEPDAAGDSEGGIA